MNALLSLLRLRPLVVSVCGVVLSLLLYFLFWPSLVPQDKSRQGALLFAGLLGIWAVTEWCLFALQRHREQRTRPGQIRQLLAGALRHLFRESQGSGWGAAESVLSRPWIVLLATAEAGVPALLTRAGFRKIVSCAIAGEPPLCTFWLLRDGAGASVCVEVTGPALLDTEGCEQLYRWLRRQRARPDAVLVQVGLQELWGSDEERARMVAVSLSPALHTLLREYSAELPVHILCNQLSRVDGMAHYFAHAERRPWGFRIDRPLHSEFQASLIHERMEAMIEGLWQQTSKALITHSIESAEVEVVLDFPREMRRVGTLLGAFTAKLCETFSSDTRARLYELFLASAEGGGGLFEAARQRRFPLGKGRLEQSAAAGSQSSYFLQGVFARIVQLGTSTAVPHAAYRQVALWASVMVCVLLMSLSTSLYQRKHRVQESLRRHVRLLEQRTESLIHAPRPNPVAARTLRQDLQGFLTSDSELQASTQRLKTLLSAKVSDQRVHKSMDDLLRKVSDFADCEAAHHLVSPLLRYDERDTGQRNLQPLYDRLGKLTDPAEPKRRGPLPVGAVPSLGKTEWFEALQAIALLERRPSCSAKSEDVAWLTDYLRQLWMIDSEVLSPPIGDQLRASTSRLLSRYLIQRDSSLLLKAQQQPLDRINNVLTSGGTLLPGQDIPAVLELELRIKELHKGSSGVAFRPKTLSYFQSRDEVAFESTRAGCQQFMDIKASELKLRCILPEAAARSLQSDSGGVGNHRLIARYSVRLERVWSDWLRQLSSRPRKPSGSLEADLVELSSATGAVLQDLPIVFRSLGTGDAAKGQNAVCVESLRSLAPFRWAVDAEDDSGQKSSEIGKLWQDYLHESNTVKDLLLQLGRPVKPTPAEEVLRGQVVMALSALSRMEDNRMKWLKELTDSLQKQSPSGSVWQEPLQKFGAQLGKLEEAILQALLTKGRRVVACRWRDLRTEWVDLQSAPPPTAAGGEDPRSAARKVLQRFRDTMIAPTGNVLTCDMQPYRLGVAIGDAGGYLVPTKFCRKFKELFDSTGVVAAPAEPAQEQAVPSVIPIPDGRCQVPSAAIRETVLEIPDLRARYVCNVSQKVCRAQEARPGPSRRVSLQVQYDYGGSSEAVSLGTLRELLSRPAPARTPAGKPTHAENDPWLQTQRYVVEVPGAPLCQGRAFRIYFDDSLVHRTLGKQGVGDAALLDSLTPELLEPCRTTERAVP